MTTVRRSPAGLRAAVLLLLTGGIACSFVGEYALLGDDATFLSLARNLAEGGGYRSPVAPKPRPEVQYPPLWPALLAPVSGGAQAGDVLLPRLLAASFAFAGLFLAFAYRGRIAPDAPAFETVAPVLVPLAFFYGTRILTEAPMLLLAYGALLSAEEGRAKRAGCFALAAMYLRQAAWGLVAGLVLHALLRRRGRAAGWILGIVLAGTTPWWIWQSMHGSDYIATHVLLADVYDPSAGTLGPIDALLRPIHHLVRYAGRSFGEALFFPWIAPPDAPVRPWEAEGAVRIAASGVLFAAFCVGWWRGWFGEEVPRAPHRSPTARFARLAERFTAEDGFLLGTGALLLFHPVYDARYLVPLLPAIAARVVSGFAALGLRGAGAMLGAAWIVGSVSLAGHRIDPGERSFVEVARLAGERTPPGAVVVSRKPAGVWMYGNRPGFSHPASPRGKDLLAAMKDGGAEYLVLDRLPGSPSSWQRHLLPALEESRDRFEVVARAPSDTRVMLLRLRIP